MLGLPGRSISDGSTRILCFWNFDSIFKGFLNISYTAIYRAYSKKLQAMRHVFKEHNNLRKMNKGFQLQPNHHDVEVIQGIKQLFGNHSLRKGNFASFKDKKGKLKSTVTGVLGLQCHWQKCFCNWFYCFNCTHCTNVHKQAIMAFTGSIRLF